MYVRTLYCTVCLMNITSQCPAKCIDFTAGVADLKRHLLNLCDPFAERWRMNL